MATLEEITRGAAVKGILPEGLVTISDVRWIGTVAIEVTYKDTAGRLGNELLYRDREPTLEIAEAGTASALGLLTIEQQMEEIIIIPARSFALAFDSCFDGFVLAQQ